METECRIPRTATRRNAVCFAKLLDRVDARAEDGFGFVGRFLQPGGRIAVSELLAGRTGSPILLERTEVEGSRGARNRMRWEAMYILWRYDAGNPTRDGAWIEIARCQSLTTDWAPQLREAARIALGRQSFGVVPKLAEVAARIRGLLDQELDPLDQAQRRLVLAELHDQFAVRIVAAAEVA